MRAWIVAVRVLEADWSTSQGCFLVLRVWGLGWVVEEFHIGIHRVECHRQETLKGRRFFGLAPSAAWLAAAFT